MGKIRWTEKASSNLESIHEYISRDSKIYATRFIKSLIRATLKLEGVPYCGRIVPELEAYGFREVIYQNYRIVYRVSSNNEDVEIMAIINGRRNINTSEDKGWELF